jgi:hypothetical protein
MKLTKTKLKQLIKEELQHMQVFEGNDHTYDVRDFSQHIRQLYARIESSERDIEVLQDLLKDAHRSSGRNLKFVSSKAKQGKE